VTALPSPPASPDHQEQLLATANTVHKNLQQQQRIRATSATSDSSTATYKDAQQIGRHKATPLPHKHNCHQNNASHITKCTYTPTTGHTGTLPNTTYTASTLHMLPHKITATYTHSQTQNHRGRAVLHLFWTVSLMPRTDQTIT